MAVPKHIESINYNADGRLVKYATIREGESEEQQFLVLVAVGSEFVVSTYNNNCLEWNQGYYRDSLDRAKETFYKLYKALG